MKNEKTSKRVAKIAGIILALKADNMQYITNLDHKGTVLTMGDLKALAASALTQTPDKKPAKRKVKRRTK